MRLPEATLQSVLSLSFRGRDGEMDRAHGRRGGVTVKLRKQENTTPASWCSPATKSPFTIPNLFVWFLRLSSNTPHPNVHKSIYLEFVLIID